MKKLIHGIMPLLFKLRYGKRFDCSLVQRKWEKFLTIIISKNGHIVIGKNANFRRNLQLRAVYEGNICLGNQIFCNTNVSITAMKRITIGNNVRIANNVVIVDHDHDFQNNLSNFISEEIIIGNDVWIGANTVILKGVHIGDHTVIAAGAVINQDIPAFVVAGGVPAKPLKIIKRK